MPTSPQCRVASADDAKSILAAKPAGNYGLHQGRSGDPKNADFFGLRASRGALSPWMKAGKIKNVSKASTDG